MTTAIAEPEPIPEIAEIPEGYSIAEESEFDFDRALRLAGGHAQAIAVIDGYEDALTKAYTEDMTALRHQLAELEKALALETHKCAKERDKRIRLLYWTFVAPFADRLPKRKQNVLLPGGLKFSWERLRETTDWARDPTNPTGELLALQFARGLPVDLQTQAIRLKPELDKTWLNKHLQMPVTEEEGPPILRVVDTETGEITELEAVVEIEIAGDVREFPIKVKVPPKEPLTYSIIYPDGRKSVYAGTPETDDPEEGEDDGSSTDDPQTAAGT